MIEKEEIGYFIDGLAEMKKKKTHIGWYHATFTIDCEIEHTVQW